MFDIFISGSELKKLLKEERVCLIDIRDYEDYINEHIENAYNYNYSSILNSDNMIEEILQKAVNDGCEYIVFYCRFGDSSYELARMTINYIEMRGKDLYNTELKKLRIKSLYGGFRNYISGRK